MPLLTHSHFHRPGDPAWAQASAGDVFYAALIEAHRGLSDAQSEALNARLVLILANHIGDLDVLREALAMAQTTNAQTKETAP